MDRITFDDGNTGMGPGTVRVVRVLPNGRAPEAGPDAVELTRTYLADLLQQEEEYANEAQRKYMAAIEQFNGDIQERNGRMAMLRQLIATLEYAAKEDDDG